MHKVKRRERGVCSDSTKVLSGTQVPGRGPPTRKLYSAETRGDVGKTQYITSDYDKLIRILKTWKLLDSQVSYSFNRA